MKFDRRKYTYRFDKVIFNNRWNKPFWNRDTTWLIFGFGIKHYWGLNKCEYYFNFFGLDFRFLFTKNI